MGLISDNPSRRGTTRSSGRQCRCCECSRASLASPLATEAPTRLRISQPGWESSAICRMDCRLLYCVGDECNCPGDADVTDRNADKITDWVSLPRMNVDASDESATHSSPYNEWCTTPHHSSYSQCTSLSTTANASYLTHCATRYPIITYFSLLSPRPIF